jgi:glycosyltransferase involved in cell wall biosynthesis
VYKRFDDILVSSDKFRDIVSKYTDNVIVYAPNWKNTATGVKSSLRLNTDEFNFTFTGNISLAQNLLNVVKGFVFAAIPNCTLNIVGDGSAMAELKAYLATTPEAKVKLCGRYPSNEMQDILRQSDACVISLVTGTALELTEPFKLQDYLMSGKPIFGAIGGSAKEIIEENELGLCSSPTDIDAIAQGFKDMLTFCKKNSDNISKKSHQLMVTRFDKSQIIERINRVIGISH